MSDEKTTLKFHFVKSPLCRDIKMSGAYGGMNVGTGEMHIVVYTERPAIPTLVEHELSTEGTLGMEIQENREGKDGLVRVVQDVLYLDFPTTVSIHKWLGEHIETYKNANPDITFEIVQS